MFSILFLFVCWQRWKISLFGAYSLMSCIGWKQSAYFGCVFIFSFATLFCTNQHALTCFKVPMIFKMFCLRLNGWTPSFFNSIPNCNGVRIVFSGSSMNNFTDKSVFFMSGEKHLFFQWILKLPTSFALLRDKNRAGGESDHSTKQSVSQHLANTARPLLFLMRTRQQGGLWGATPTPQRGCCHCLSPFMTLQKADSQIVCAQVYHFWLKERDEVKLGGIFAFFLGGHCEARETCCCLKTHRNLLHPTPLTFYIFFHC